MKILGNIENVGRIFIIFHHHQNDHHNHFEGYNIVSCFSKQDPYLSPDLFVYHHHHQQQHAIIIIMVTVTECHLPPGWAGVWFQQGVRPYSTIDR